MTTLPEDVRFVGSTPEMSTARLPCFAISFRSSGTDFGVDIAGIKSIGVYESGISKVNEYVRLSELMEIDIFDEIQKMRQQGRKAALATIVQIRGSVPSFQSAKMLVRDDGSTLGSVGGGCVEAEVWTAAQDVIRDEKSKILSFDLTDESMAESGLICGGKVEIFVEPILSTPKIVVFGAGHIASQVSKIATIAGFRTTVVDNRPVYANAERFPEAEAIFSESFEQAFEEIVPNENTYVIIVTRGHQEDQNVLRWAVQTDARYIGMIGSKRKIRSIVEQLETEGIPRERLERVYMPIGLDIGAVLPEEIAVAIVAEVIHVRRAGFKHPLSKKLLQTTRT
jgi:xanthine dehydrogenase accessory factor